MKTYVIILSKVFPKGHIRQGEMTGFREKLISGEKIHTIRTNYGLWRQRIKEVKNGEACISLRQWQDKPYRSKQIEIARLTKENGVGIESISLPPIGQLSYALDSFPGLDAHDGLSKEDWLSWFENAPRNQPLPIIHFTPFRYYD
ncbi:MAG: hypothetical protein K2H18_03445 [Muribaculaceae bacterium]|nr:hypothetical protein [Muribaculaceae bacterium]